MSTPESPLLIAIADKLAKHQLIRQSDYLDTVLILKEIPAIRSHAALVEALKKIASMFGRQGEIAFKALGIDASKLTAQEALEALRQAEEGK